MRALQLLSISLVLSGSLLLPSFAAAEATLGVYGDPSVMNVSGQYSISTPIDLYVLLLVEDVANAVGYSINFPGRNDWLLVSSEIYGPTGNGLNASTENGEAVGLAGCFPGFNAVPIQVARYVIFITEFRQGPFEISLGANPDADREVFHPGPIYSRCDGTILDIENQSTHRLEEAVDVVPASFGEIKALY